eukprot:3103793-Prymnesium_polylepis.1
MSLRGHMETPRKPDKTSLECPGPRPCVTVRVRVLMLVCEWATRTRHTNMARVRDARTTRVGSDAEVEHQAGAGTARGSVMQ